MSKSKLKSRLDGVESRSDLIEFIQALSDDLKDVPEQWENSSLSDYLDAMSAWVDDMEGYYRNQGKNFSGNPSWKMFAEILYASRIYE